MGKGYHKSNNSKSGVGDLSSLRGYGCVIATCDVAREREATKELLNLLTQIIDELYPIGASNSSTAEAHPASSASIENILAAEIRQCSAKQPVISINSGVKGFVVVKIVSQTVCPIRLVQAIFDQVERTKLTLSRHICRIVPLSKVFFANESEFETNMKSLIQETFNLPSDTSVEDDQPRKKIKQDDITAVVSSGEPCDGSSSSDGIENISKRNFEQIQTSAPLTPISILFKKRNHNTLSRVPIQQFVFSHIPRNKCTVDFKNPKAVFIVELFMNTCGISYFSDIDKYEELNLKKFQQLHCHTEDKVPPTISSSLVDDRNTAVGDRILTEETIVKSNDSS